MKIDFLKKNKKNFNDLKEYYLNDKIPICLIHTYTINQKTIYKFFMKILGKYDKYITTCKLLAKKIEFKNEDDEEEDEDEDGIAAFGIDYLINKTLEKLMKLCKDDNINQNYLLFQNDKKKNQESLMSIIEQIHII